MTDGVREFYRCSRCLSIVDMGEEEACGCCESVLCHTCWHLVGKCRKEEK